MFLPLILIAFIYRHSCPDPPGMLLGINFYLGFMNRGEDMLESQPPAVIAKELMIALIQREGIVIPKLSTGDTPDSITHVRIMAEMYNILFREINKSFQSPKRTMEF